MLSLCCQHLALCCQCLALCRLHLALCCQHLALCCLHLALCCQHLALCSQRLALFHQPVLQFLKDFQQAVSLKIKLSPCTMTGCCAVCSSGACHTGAAAAVCSNCCRLQFAPTMVWCCLLQLWCVAVCSNCGVLLFAPTVVCCSLLQLWCVAVCSNCGVLQFAPVGVCKHGHDQRSVMYTHFSGRLLSVLSPCFFVYSIVH